MEIREGTRLIGRGEKRSIIEFIFSDYSLNVFQGDISPNDILIKYKELTRRIRTPKHIHWVIDIMIKMQGDSDLTREYLREIQNWWNNCNPLVNNNFETLRNIVEERINVIDIARYRSLNAYGEYDIEFLYVLMVLLVIQEKTNRHDAYVFGGIIGKLLEEGIDIFGIVSAATYGRRG